MNKLKNHTIGKISLYLSLGLIIIFIIIVVVFSPKDTRDRLLIFDSVSNYSEEDILTFPKEFGIIEYPSSSYEPRFDISTFPTYIILSHDRKNIKFVTDKKEKLFEYYESEHIR